MIEGASLGVFLISAVRAVLEMLGICLLGQGGLYILAGKGRASNPIYQLFNLITKAPRCLVAKILNAPANSIGVNVLCFLILFLAWIGLAFLRKSI